MPEKRIILTPVAQKSFRRLSGDPARSEVEVVIPARSGENERFIRICFPASSITLLAELSPDYTALVLASGTQIAVKMPYDELRERLKSGDAVIDLKTATGGFAKDAPPGLELVSDRDCLLNMERADKEPETRLAGKPVTIRLFVAPEKGSLNLKEFSFTSDEIEHSWQDHSEKNWGYLKLLDRSPFKTIKGFYFKMDKKKFMGLLNKAQIEGKTELDLRRQTGMNALPKPDIDTAYYKIPRIYR